jgi:hypothetical protein
VRHFEIRNSESLIQATLESKECIDVFVGGLEQLMDDPAELGIEKRITFPKTSEFSYSLHLVFEIWIFTMKKSADGNFLARAWWWTLRCEQSKLSNSRATARVKTGLFTGGPRGPQFSS